MLGISAEEGLETVTGTQSETEAVKTSEAATGTESTVTTETDTTTETDAEIEDDTEKEAGTEEETTKEETELTVELSFFYAEKEYTATVKLQEELTAEAAAGELEYCQSQYDPKKTVTLIAEKSADCIIGDFPAMTSYQIEDENYVLYNGGKILIPAGKTLSLDLSKTELKEDFTITTANGKAHTMKYIPLPKLSEETFPLVIGAEGYVFAESEKWGAIAPEFFFEQLSVGEETAWNAVECFSIEENEEGKLQMLPEGAEAGTYRVKILWKENEVKLYEKEIPFFIQYESVDQGGSGQ